MRTEIDRIAKLDNSRAEYLKRVKMGCVALDPLTMSDAVDRIIGFVGRLAKRAAVVATVNAQFIHIASREKRFATFLSHAEVVVADSMPVVYASHILKRPLPDRIAGVDLMVQLCERAARENLAVYLLGGRPGSAEETVRRLQMRFPKLVVAGVDCPEMGFDRDTLKSSAVVARLRKANPDIIFVGLGAPKQGYWIEEHAPSFPGKIMMGVGGSFDLLAGKLKRAPFWMQKIGMEWIFRLCLEPRRLWKRYLFGNFKFIQIVFQQWLWDRK